MRKGTAPVKEENTNPTETTYQPVSPSKEFISDTGQFAYYELFPANEQGSFLTVEFANGNKTSLPYHLISRIDHDLSKGITVEFTECKLLIEGSHLDKLRDELLLQRVSVVRERRSGIIEGVRMLGKGASLIITKIFIK